MGFSASLESSKDNSILLANPKLKIIVTSIVSKYDIKNKLFCRCEVSIVRDREMMRKHLFFEFLWGYCCWSFLCSEKRTASEIDVPTVLGNFDIVGVVARNGFIARPFLDDVPT